MKISRTFHEELKKLADQPSWKSDNEGIHERVNFDDTIWGFNLAGGAYYNTALRVTHVKKDSRAERVGIKVGDSVKYINGIETSTLTVQEAHDLILNSGIEIKLNVTAPDIDEPAYFVYQDDLEDEVAEQKRRRQTEEPVMNLQYKGARTNQAWSIAWPCNKKRDILYKESNCFLVPSVYENKHPEKIPTKKSNNEMRENDRLMPMAGDRNTSKI